MLYESEFQASERLAEYVKIRTRVAGVAKSVTEMRTRIAALIADTTDTEAKAELQTKLNQFNAAVAE